jgi:hypothetical protein
MQRPRIGPVRCWCIWRPRCAENLVILDHADLVEDGGLAKEAIWRLVGLDSAGKNPAVCRKDSKLKEVQPMFGNCSYGDCAPTARWPYVCAQEGCGKFVDLKCCEKSVEASKLKSETVRL